MANENMHCVLLKTFWLTNINFLNFLNLLIKVIHNQCLEIAAIWQTILNFFFFLHLLFKRDKNDKNGRVRIISIAYSNLCKIDVNSIIKMNKSFIAAILLAVSATGAFFAFSSTNGDHNLFT